MLILMIVYGRRIERMVVGDGTVLYFHRNQYTTNKYNKNRHLQYKCLDGFCNQTRDIETIQCRAKGDHFKHLQWTCIDFDEDRYQFSNISVQCESYNDIVDDGIMVRNSCYLTFHLNKELVPLTFLDRYMPLISILIIIIIVSCTCYFKSDMNYIYLTTVRGWTVLNTSDSDHDNDE